MTLKPSSGFHRAFHAAVGMVDQDAVTLSRKVATGNANHSAFHQDRVPAAPAGVDRIGPGAWPE
jgi:hypothetical protein